MAHKTKVLKATSGPVQIGPGQAVMIETTAVYVLVDEDLETLLKMLGTGYEMQGAFPWGEMTIAIVKTVRPTKIQTGASLIKPQGGK